MISKASMKEFYRVGGTTFVVLDGRLGVSRAVGKGDEIVSIPRCLTLEAK